MITVTEDHVASFSAFLATTLPPEVANGAQFRRHIARHLEELAELSGADLCERRHAALGSICDAGDLAERMLLDKDGRTAIGGIRFRNSDPRWPFVEVNANFDLLRRDTLAEVSELARQQFRSLVPRGVLFTGPAGRAAAIGASVWTHTVFGPIGSGSTTARSSIEITFPEDVTFYEQYLDEYAQWQPDSPDLKAFVKPESRDDLEEAASAGLLAVAQDAAGWCGLVAARSEPFFGTDAVYIFELFVPSRRRGEGIARAVDNALVSRLSQSHGYVWEDIHDQNLPSLRTAERSGRQAVRTDYFIRL